MQAFVQAIHQHPALYALVGYYIFSAFVSGMPSPSDKSSMGYVWAFNSLHTLAGNLGRVVMRNGNGDAPKP